MGIEVAKYEPYSAIFIKPLVPWLQVYQSAVAIIHTQGQFHENYAIFKEFKYNLVYTYKFNNRQVLWLLKSNCCVSNTIVHTNYGQTSQVCCDTKEVVLDFNVVFLLRWD